MARTKVNPYAQIPPAILRRNKQMLKMIADGKHPSEVAQIFGISRQRVLKIVQRGK